ncbi:MAG TPA: TIGR04290 family methyltransferase [Longimicrobium sp.]|nr:TIGR04290 family methyltransferase [Longimicrobium sp.]
MTPLELERRVRSMDPWFHDLDIHGVRTAPDHPLGNFLRNLWSVVEPSLPADMTGMTALDIGCNAGFYSHRLHERGARVTAIDHDERYLAQARFAAEQLGYDIDFRHVDVYDVESLGQKFDYVIFMGVLYHLRHPLLALDRIAGIVNERLVVQCMVRGTPAGMEVDNDYSIEERAIFDDPRFPAMYFVEGKYAGDWTNWWIPNEAGLGAMLRSAGLRLNAHPAPEVYICSPAASGAGAP